MSVWTTTPGVELTQDRLFTRRIRRLIGISLVMLGVISWLATANDAATWIVALMLVGWLLMPSLLLLSLKRPELRYGLLLPGSAFTLGVLAMALQAQGAQALGWWLIAVGLTIGGTAGIWFWMRWLPVPKPFDDPYGWPRLAVIGVHAALVVAGIAILAAT